MCSCSGVWLAGDTGLHEVACSRMKSPIHFRSNSMSTGEIDQQVEKDQGKTVEEAGFEGRNGNQGELRRVTDAGKQEIKGPEA